MSSSATNKKKHCVSSQEAEAMFKYWVQVKDTDGILGVARKFGRNRATVYRQMERGKWKERYEQIRQAVQRKQDKEIEREEEQNLKLVRAVKKTIAEHLLERLKNQDYDVTVNELISLIRLEEELIGGLSPESRGNVVNLITYAVDNKSDDEKRHILRNLNAVYGTNGDRFTISDRN
jgi:hypothetical protein